MWRNVLLQSCLLFVALVTLARAGFGQTEANLLQRGLDKYQRRDFAGAIADFTQAIELSPEATYPRLLRGRVRNAQGDFAGQIADCDAVLKMAPDSYPAYKDRGQARRALGAWDDALADFTRAIALRPDVASLYDQRAALLRRRGDLAGAFFDYSDAIDLDPGLGPRYGWRAHIWMDRGDVGRAMADYNRAIELEPSNDAGYDMRGLAYFVQRDWSDALHDYEKACDLGGDQVEYARLFIWLIRQRLGDRAAADHELAAFVDKAGRAKFEPWFEKVCAFLLGRITEPELFQAAVALLASRDREQHCEAWFYAGMKRLLAGDRATAADYLRKCLATDVRDFVEFTGARAELKWLQ